MDGAWNHAVHVATSADGRKWIEPGGAGLQPMDGAWNHAVHVATSADGRKWIERDAPVRVRATSPDVLVLSGKGGAGEAGLLALYTLDMASGGNLSLSRWLSNDAGNRWYATPGISIEGDWGGAVRDVSVVQLDDGRIRMYVVLPPAPRTPGRDLTPPGQPPDQPPMPTPPGPPNRPKFPEPPRIPTDPVKGEAPPVSLVRSAISSDGLKFVVEEGNRFEAEGIASADVMFVGSQWVMVIGRGGNVFGAR
jgi:hypothetical protein